MTELYINGQLAVLSEDFILRWLLRIRILHAVPTIHWI